MAGPYDPATGKLTKWNPFPGLSKMKGGASTSFKILKGGGQIFKALGTAMTEALGPIMLFVTLLEQLGVLQPLMDLFSAFMAILGTGLQPLLMLLINTLVPLLPPFQQLVTAMTPLITLVGLLLLPFGEIAMYLPVLTVGFQALGWILNQINPFIIALSDSLMIIKNSIGQFFADLATSFIEGLTNGWAGIGDWFRNLPHMIIDALKNGWNNLGTEWREFWT